VSRNQHAETQAAGSGLPVTPSGSTEPMTFTYKTLGDCEIKLDFWGVESDARKPVMLYIHGGGLIMGTRKTIRPWFNPQASHVLVSIDYRLAPETKLPAIIEDLQDAIRWVRQKGPELFNVDLEKLVVAGESAGGYLTLMSGFCVEPRPKALVTISGYGDITGTWYSRPSEFYLRGRALITKDEAYQHITSTCVSERPNNHSQFYFYCRQQGIWPREVAGHDPDTEASWFRPYCPVRNVSADYPPTVLIHGTADNDVPWDESDALDKVLIRHQVPHKFISVPGGSHALHNVSDDDKARIFAEVMTFVAQHAS
jgi:acetyl esterase/lipase